MDSMSRQWPVNQSLILSRHAQRGQQTHLCSLATQCGTQRKFCHHQTTKRNGKGGRGCVSLKGFFFWGGYHLNALNPIPNSFFDTRQHGILDLFWAILSLAAISTASSSGTSFGHSRSATSTTLWQISVLDV